MLPTLSLLDLARALQIKPSNVQEIKPLCENIFDVPRSELLETYERLRDSFWTDPAESTPSPPARPKPPVIHSVPAQPQQVTLETPPTLPTETTPTRPRGVKRAASESLEPDGKPDKLPRREYTHKELMASAVLSTTETMWGYKKWFIQELRRDEQSYKEETISARVNDLEGLLTPVEKRRLAQYLQPVLASLGRRGTQTDITLSTWLSLASPQQATAAAETTQSGKQAVTEAP